MTYQPPPGPNLRPDFLSAASQGRGQGKGPAPQQPERAPQMYQPGQHVGGSGVIGGPGAYTMPFPQAQQPQQQAQLPGRSPGLPDLSQPFRGGKGPARGQRGPSYSGGIVGENSFFGNIFGGGRGGGKK